MENEDKEDIQKRHPFKDGVFPFPFASYDQFICIGFCAYKSKEGMKKHPYKFKKKCLLNETKTE